MNIRNSAGKTHSEGDVRLEREDCVLLMHALDIAHSNGDPAWYIGQWQDLSYAAKQRLTLENLHKTLLEHA